MPGKVLYALGAVCVLAVAGGCDINKSARATPELQATDPSLYLPDTVGRRARLAEGRALPVRGYCVAVGLGQNGSPQVPGALKSYLVQYLLKEGRLKSYEADTQDLTPARFLRDRATAVVEINGLIPRAAPVGTRFDVVVSAVPQTETRSLDGGHLMPTNLRLSMGGMTEAGRGSDVLAQAAGSIFVNPFLDRHKPSDQIKLRRGHIIGGGVVLKSRPVRLSLFQPNYATCQVIQRRINERFPGPKPVAVGRDSSILDIHIPRQERADYRHFLDLVLHVPIHAGEGVWEQMARKIGKAIEQPEADFEDYALTWEAIGRQVLPVIRHTYRSRNAAAAYYAARTGLRLGDGLAAEIVMRYAVNDRSALQIEAIRELGRHRSIGRASLVLHKLLDSSNDVVREAAYESLVQRGDWTVVSRVKVADDLDLDLVTTSSRPAIYVSRTGRQRLVLFGRDMRVQTPVFYNAAGDVVTVNSNASQKKLTVFRKMPRTGQYSDSLQIAPTVKDLIVTLGSAPNRDLDGKVRGLWLTYSQVVGVLHGMCKAGDIRAKFRLQRPEGLKKILRRRPQRGRPDLPGT